MRREGSTTVEQPRCQGRSGSARVGRARVNVRGAKRRGRKQGGSTEVRGAWSPDGATWAKSYNVPVLSRVPVAEKQPGRSI